MPSFAFRGNANVIEAFEERLAEAGFSREGEVEIADFVLTYCTNMTALEDLYFGDDGLVQLMNKGACAIDLSPAVPSFANEVSAVATVNDICFVCAPMIVKNKVAENAFARVNLRTFAASESDGIKQAIKMLEAIYGDVHEVPNVSTAQLLRAANTMQNTAEMVAATEVLSMFSACSKTLSELDLAKMAPEATSPEAYFIMEAIKKSNFEGGYNVEMLLGELSSAIMCADDYELIMPQTEAAFHLFELLAVVGGVDLSPSAIALVYEGEGSEAAKKYGLDWQRMKDLYDNSSDDEFIEDYDSAHEGDELFEDYDFYDEDDLADGTGSQFGYSVN